MIDDELVHVTCVPSHVDPGVRADSRSLESNYMRHRVRRNWQALADIGAGRRVVDMVRNGVRIPLKNGPPAPFNQGVSMEDATPDQLRFCHGLRAAPLSG
eukprot:jgi/Tetstr1/434155/TSEL_002479.t1